MRRVHVHTEPCQGVYKNRVLACLLCTAYILMPKCAHLFSFCFLPRDASAESGYEIACRPSFCLSVRLSVCNDQVRCSNTLEFFKNNFTANSLRPMCSLTRNVGDLVQREHPQNYGGIGVGSEAHKTCSSSETVQDRTKVTITD